MKVDFPALMKAKSEEELKKYIDDYVKYMPEAIEAAINELAQRGNLYSPSELENFRSLIQKQKNQIEEKDKEFAASLLMDSELVYDGEFPVLYSQNTIFQSSLFFGAITGSILLAINIRRVNQKRGIYPTIIFGVLYTSFQIWFVMFGRLDKFARSQNPLSIWMILSGLGAIILNMIFWRL